MFHSTFMIGVMVAIGVALATLGAWFWWACTVPSSRFFSPVLVRGPAEGQRLALTFDDGPASPYTEQILQILANYKIPATFFLCGKNVERLPDLARRIVAEGHTVGNHTFTHPFLYFRSRATIAGEIDRTQDIIEKTTGVRPKVFRPPYGGRWIGLLPVLRERGLSLVQWSDPGYDWKKARHDIIRLTLRRLRGGSVLLLHDGMEPRAPGEVNQSETVAALPDIIEGAQQRGFKFVSVLEFL